ncbi:MAG: sigma-70 family RNA polymerase sigma factor [Candidatus Obscuribacterales bacterium]|nr:sigma-70 family RNA polymerase sigma factor [Candidatus Obscuribacterales bacterium]
MSLLATNSETYTVPVVTTNNHKLYSEKDNFELIIASRTGDERAFEELVKRHEGQVYGLLYHLAPDWRDISDLVQQVFIKVWCSIGDLRNLQAFESWLRHIAVNVFYAELRKRPRRLREVSLDEPIDSERRREGTRDIAATMPGPEEICEGQELMGLVKEAVNDLPQQFRVAIVLREFQGLAYEEIAAITGTEIGTVKSRISRARTRIQKAIAPYLEVTRH